MLRQCCQTYKWRCYFKGKMCDVGIHLYILTVVFPTFTCNTNQLKRLHMEENRNWERRGEERITNVPAVFPKRMLATVKIFIIFLQNCCYLFFFGLIVLPSLSVSVQLQRHQVPFKNTICSSQALPKPLSPLLLTDIVPCRGARHL